MSKAQHISLSNGITGEINQIEAWDLIHAEDRLAIIPVTVAWGLLHQIYLDSNRSKSHAEFLKLPAVASLLNDETSQNWTVGEVRDAVDAIATNGNQCGLRSRFDGQRSIVLVSSKAHAFGLEPYWWNDARVNNAFNRAYEVALWRRIKDQLRAAGVSQNRAAKIANRDRANMGRFIPVIQQLYALAGAANEEPGTLLPDREAQITETICFLRMQFSSDPIPSDIPASFIADAASLAAYNRLCADTHTSGMLPVLIAKNQHRFSDAYSYHECINSVLRAAEYVTSLVPSLEPAKRK